MSAENNQQLGEDYVMTPIGVMTLERAKYWACLIVKLMVEMKGGVTAMRNKKSEIMRNHPLMPEYEKTVRLTGEHHRVHAKLIEQQQKPAAKDYESKLAKAKKDITKLKAKPTTLGFTKERKKTALKKLKDKRDNLVKPKTPEYDQLCAYRERLSAIEKEMGVEKLSQAIRSKERAKGKENVNMGNQWENTSLDYVQKLWDGKDVEILTNVHVAGNLNGVRVNAELDILVLCKETGKVLAVYEAKCNVYDITAAYCRFLTKTLLWLQTQSEKGGPSAKWFKAFQGFSIEQFHFIAMRPDENRTPDTFIPVSANRLLKVHFFNNPMNDPFHPESLTDQAIRKLMSKITNKDAPHLTFAQVEKICKDRIHYP